MYSSSVIAKPPLIPSKCLNSVTNARMFLHKSILLGVTSVMHLILHPLFIISRKLFLYDGVDSNIDGPCGSKTTSILEPVPAINEFIFSMICMGLLMISDLYSFEILLVIPIHY
jgi:hypothetical protein